MQTAADPSLFASCLAPVLDVAYGIAFYLTGNGAEAEDIVQEAAVQAYRAYSDFRTGSNFNAWFLKALIKVVRNRRQQSRRRFGSGNGKTVALRHRSNLADPYHPRAAEILHPIPDFTRLTPEQIADAFAQLPQRYRLACALYMMGDFSYQEIADILGCPFETIRSCIHRGRKALLALLCGPAEKRSYYAVPAAV